jgi:transcriptional regulator with XRE-family HTH domain
MTMKSNRNISTLAAMAGISKSMLSQIISGKRKAGWRSAKRLSVVTGTHPLLWLEGSLDEIKVAIYSRKVCLDETIKTRKQESLCRALNVPCAGKVEEA